MIRVLIADDSRLICDAMRTILDGDKSVYVVGCARTLEEATFLTPHADLLLVGTTLEGDSTLDFVRTVNTEHAGKKVIVVGVPDQPEEIMRFIEAGAIGYVLRQDSMSKLVEKIHAVEAGQALVSPDIVFHLMRRLTQLAQQPFAGGWGLDSTAGMHELTAREREVLSLIGAGYSNREIADHLVIGWGTVKNHVHSILKKLETNSRHEAAAMYRVHARQNGPLPLAA
jgi:DNA-binding NarL/FixJ family response regulator